MQQQPGMHSPLNDEAGGLRQQHLAGNYEILRVVNRGGMGEIAMGRVRGTAGFEKLVVLKRLRADAEREDHIEMFDVEQELMSRIEHPNIVKVFDQPVIDDVHYLAMEYVRGRNLDQMIRKAKTKSTHISARFALSIIYEVLRGLAFVHRLKDGEGSPLGVVHQDMTPSNVMLSFFGEVKITDFGISYVTSRDGGLRKGVLKGKPRYVAPEVLAGKRVNNRADIYGVAVVLHELLTGEALFARPSVKETLSAVARNELPDFEQELGHLGSGVASIMDKALRRDPNDRYRTAEAMAGDVLGELNKNGGPLSAAIMGHLLRQYFEGDPDLPEIDPDFDEKIAQQALEQDVGDGLGAPATPPDLDQTLAELDRLLGDDEHSEVFTLPPEVEAELAGLEDMEPFDARTPLPDFVWEAKSEAEILEKAREAYGSDALIREAPDLAGAPASASVIAAKSPLPRSASSSSSAPIGASEPPPSIRNALQTESPASGPVPRSESRGAYTQIGRTTPDSPRDPEPDVQTNAAAGRFSQGLWIGLLVGATLGAAAAVLALQMLG